MIQCRLSPARPSVPPLRTALCLTAALWLLAGCAADYSPDTYSSSAVQQANKVEPGIVVGFREVKISASGTIGAVAGGAVGGVLGAQMTGDAALGTAVGGTVIGTLVGNTIEHSTSDTTGWEYIVRKPNGDMLSLTQREPKPLAIGQHVLVITGSQARVIPDYSVAIDPPAKAKATTVADKDDEEEVAPKKKHRKSATEKPAAPDAPVTGATGEPTAPATPTAPTSTPAIPATPPTATAAAAPVTVPAAPPIPSATTTTPAPVAAPSPSTASDDDTPAPPPRPAVSTPALPANMDGVDVNAITALIDSLHTDGQGGNAQGTATGTPN